MFTTTRAKTLTTIPIEGIDVNALVGMRQSIAYHAPNSRWYMRGNIAEQIAETIFSHSEAFENSENIPESLMGLGVVIDDTISENIIVACGDLNGSLVIGVLKQ